MQSRFPPLSSLKEMEESSNIPLHTVQASCGGATGRSGAALNGDVLFLRSAILIYYLANYFVILHIYKTTI